MSVALGAVLPIRLMMPHTRKDRRAFRIAGACSDQRACSGQTSWGFEEQLGNSHQRVRRAVPAQSSSLYEFISLGVVRKKVFPSLEDRQDYQQRYK